MLYRVRFLRDLWIDRMRAWFGVPLECGARGDPAARARRESPPEELRFRVDGHDALLCYGRPSANGRTVFGGLVPFGELWRLGANEPTTLHLPFPATIGGLRVARGKLSLYCIPDSDRWTLILNRSTRQWGITRTETGAKGNVFHSAYTPMVRRAELGRVQVETDTVPHVERLTARTEESEGTTVLLFEWETTRIRIPIRA